VTEATKAAEKTGLAGREPGARLVFDDVSHVFADGTRVLSHVSLRVGEGEFVALIGPSGCGKSTMLRLAAGLIRPAGGRVLSDRQDTGFVFQEPTLLPFRTVLGNVELFGELERLPKAERRRLAMEVLERVGLAGFEHKYPKALSGGMKMRASLARSLVLRPSLFLLDEPFAAVDEITRQRLNDQLMQLYARDRFAAMFVTHSVSEACYLASKVVVLTNRPARVLAEVEVPFAYPRPADLRFSAEFSAKAREVSEHLAASGA
jgi:NitT/TauT family transport system ATP-binding protein